MSHGVIALSFCAGRVNHVGTIHQKALIGVIALMAGPQCMVLCAEGKREERKRFEVKNARS